MSKPGDASRDVRDAIVASDVWLAVQMPLLLLLSWAVPARSWNAVCRAIHAAGKPFRKPNALEARIAEARPPGLAAVAPASLVDELEAGRLEHYLQILRDYRPGGWRQDVDIEGLDRLRAALGEGRGAILWVDHFVFNGLAPKKGLHDAGFAFSHLSRPEHGFSKTRFGIRYLNPVRSRIEDRYLEERVLIARGAEARSVKRLLALLKRGKVVSITAGAWEGRKVAPVPVLGASLPISTGAASIAIASGAPLIPVATVRDEGSDTFRVVLDDPISWPRDLPKADAMEAIFAAYGRHLETWIASHPGQWRGWKYLRRD